MAQTKLEQEANRVLRTLDDCTKFVSHHNSYLPTKALGIFSGSKTKDTEVNKSAQDCLQEATGLVHEAMSPKNTPQLKA